MGKCKLLLGLCFCLFLVFCSKNNEITAPNNNSPQSIVPLNVGNKWLFQQDYLDTLGNVTNSTTDSMMVLRDTIYQNEKWFFIGTSKAWIVRADGFYYASLHPGKIDTPTFQFKYPCQLNETITRIRTDTTKIVVENLAASISVLAGSFTCIQYTTYRNSALYEKDYLCPGVGFVRIEYYTYSTAGTTQGNPIISQPRIESRRDLKSFTLN